jgi:hypothetical protein
MTNRSFGDLLGINTPILSLAAAEEAVNRTTML